MSASTEPHRRRRIREVAAQFGGTESVATDAPRYDWRDPYHALLAMGWGPFLLGVLGYYLALNAVFGTLYALRPGSVANLPPGRWDDAFFFSVETFGTVGYGAMAPQTAYGHLVATVRNIPRTAVHGGPHRSDLRALRPTTRQHGIQPAYHDRTARRRTDAVASARQSPYRHDLPCRRVPDAGSPISNAGRPHDVACDDLPLMRSRVQALSLVWTLRHVIDDASPLHGLSIEQLAEMDAQLLVSITGTDATLAAPVHAMHAYEPSDLLWGFRFDDVMTVDGRGRTRIELARLHDVLPA